METRHSTKNLVHTWEFPGKESQKTVRLDIDGNTLWITEDQQAELLAALRESRIQHTVYQPEEQPWWHQGLRWGAFVGLAGGLCVVFLPVALEAAAAWLYRAGSAVQDFTAGLLTLVAALIVPAGLVLLVVVVVWWWLRSLSTEEPEPPAPRKKPQEEGSGGVVINNITHVYQNHTDHV